MRDAHIHFFSDDIARNSLRYADDANYRVIYGATPAPLCDAKRIASYLEESGTEECVALGFSWFRDDAARAENDALLAAGTVLKNKAMLFGSVALESDFPAADAERMKREGFHGIGEIAFYADAVHWTYLEEIFTAAADLAMPVMLHINEPVGHAYPGKYATDFAHLLDLIERHPSLELILAHLGGGLLFYEMMPEVRRILANCRYDTAALPYLYEEQFLDVALAAAPGKIIFGSDYPLLKSGRYGKHIATTRNQIAAATDEFFTSLWSRASNTRKQ